MVYYMIWYDMIYDMVYYMIWYDMIYYIIYLTAMGLTPGGSSTTHIYTQSTEKGKFGKSGRATSFRVIPRHLPYN
jgi:hypothetical protein